MTQYDDNEREYPEPETVLAIRGAIATALRDHAEILQGFEHTARQELLYTTAGYLAMDAT